MTSKINCKSCGGRKVLSGLGFFPITCTRCDGTGEEPTDKLNSNLIINHFHLPDSVQVTNNKDKNPKRKPGRPKKVESN